MKYNLFYLNTQFVPCYQHSPLDFNIIHTVPYVLRYLFMHQLSCSTQCSARQFVNQGILSTSSIQTD